MTRRISSCIFVYIRYQNPILIERLLSFIFYPLLYCNKNILVYALRFILLNTLCYITFQPTFNLMLDLAILLEYASPLYFQDGGHKYLRVVIFFDQTYYTNLNYKNPTTLQCLELIQYWKEASLFQMISH